MKTNYLLTAIMVTLIACNNDSPKNNTTASNFTIAPAPAKKLQRFKTDTRIFSSLEDDVEPITKSISTFTEKEYKNLVSKLTPKAQKFSFSIHSDTVINCNQGTLIKVDAGSFVTADWGKPVTGNVELQVREFYELSDMVLAGLSTTSNKQLLETGGMIHIAAFSNGEKCKLKDEASIEIGFPTDNKKEGMQLFTAFVDRRGGFNWTLASEDVGTIMPVIEKPGFPGGDSSLVKYLENNFKHPDLSKLRVQFNRVFVSFIVDAKGEIAETKVLNGISPDIDNEVVNLICNMPAWIPAKEDGQKVSVRIELPVYFGLDPKRTTTPYRIFKSNYLPPEEIAKKQTNEKQFYFLKTEGLGWLNCDRFLPNSNNQVIVTSKKGTVMGMQMVFHNLQVIVPGQGGYNKFYFSRLPKGEPVTLFAFGYVDDQPYMVIKETTTDEASYQIDFNQPLSKEKINAAMKKIEKGLMASK